MDIDSDMAVSVIGGSFNRALELLQRGMGWIEGRIRVDLIIRIQRLFP